MDTENSLLNGYRELIKMNNKLIKKYKKIIKIQENLIKQFKEITRNYKLSDKENSLLKQVTKK